MLVPIFLDDVVQGVISVGEARNWNRRAFGATDLIFAKDVAAKCSLALLLRKMHIDVERGRRQLNRMSTGQGMPWGNIRSRIKSPLTSIIGAVELLKANGPADDFSNKYHDLILRSADRIRTLTDDDYIDEEEKVKAESEMVVG
jgi:nitrogen-specific signal transduction histidine kinase